MDTVTQRNIIKLKVREKTADTLHLSWDCGATDYEYDLDAKQIKALSKEVRDSLQTFVDAWCKKKLSDAVRDFCALCEAGHDLYRALFQGERVKEWEAQELVENHQNEHRIIVKVSSHICVPWGLVRMTGKPMIANSDNPDWSHICHPFWACQFALTGTIISHPPSKSLSGINSYDIARVVHKKLYEKTCASLDDTSEKTIMEWVDEVCKPVFDGIAEFREFVRTQQSSKLIFGYLFGHADASTFAVSETEKISAVRFNTDLRDFVGYSVRSGGGQPRLTVLFLNGCSTVEPAAAYGWQDLVQVPGLHGLIGTEVPIPDLFAARFANAFFYYFVGKGRSLMEAFHALREQHLPLSLLYTLYGLDTLAVDPRPIGADVEEVRFTNFSSRPFSEIQ